MPLLHKVLSRLRGPGDAPVFSSAELIRNPQTALDGVRWPSASADGRGGWRLAWPEGWGRVAVFAAGADGREPAGTPLAETTEPGVTVPAVGVASQPLFMLRTKALNGAPPVVLVAPRIVELDAVLNLRDVGGYPTANGRTVRWRSLYRSGQLSRLTPAAGVRLRDELGVRHVWDMRSDDEARRQPSALPQGTAIAHRPLGLAGSRWLRLYRILRQRRQLRRTMHDTYRASFVDAGARTLGRVLAEISRAPGAALIHCTAGKDRTGVVVAVLLRLLGVPEAVVIADYSISNRWTAPLAASLHREFAPLYRIGLTPGQLRPLLVADPAYLAAALHQIDTRHGGAEAYLRGPGGLSAAAIERLRRKLLR